MGTYHATDHPKRQGQLSRETCHYVEPLDQILIRRCSQHHCNHVCHGSQQHRHLPVKYFQTSSEHFTDMVHAFRGEITASKDLNCTDGGQAEAKMCCRHLISHVNSLNLQLSVRELNPFSKCTAHNITADHCTNSRTAGSHTPCRLSPQRQSPLTP